MMDQDMGKILIDASVQSFIGVCQRASGNLASDAHVIQFVLHAEQTSRNVSKALAIGQLCKEQAEILIQTTERLNFMIPVVALDALTH
jgi:hypothetical protein